MRLSTFILALFTLVAFATNSILCRQALMTGSIGPIEFTAIRLGSGIVALLVLMLFLGRLLPASLGEPVPGESPFRLKIANLKPSAALFGYALFFSLAYLQLDAGVGALVLFAVVQITMIGISIVEGNRVGPIEWLGVAISFAGLVYLLSPGLSAPPPLGTGLMIAAGVSWGIYSLLGRNQRQPIVATVRNFLFCLPAVLILGIVALIKAPPEEGLAITGDGFLLAVLSGAVASGMGYVLWYLTVRRITTTVASVSQLVVPVLAAVGGIMFLGESLSLRLTVASVLIIGGIVITIVGRKAPRRAPAPILAEEGGAQS